MHVSVCLCVSGLCLCELLFAGYRTSYWQAIANPWFRNGKGDNITKMSPVSLLLVMPAINSATDGQEQFSLKRWLNCCCMQVDTSQKNFTLQEASLKVKVEDGQIQEINVSAC